MLDHLGTTRAELKFVEDAGDLIPTITAGYDVLPYGEMLDEWHAPSSPIEDLPEALPTEYTEQVLFTGKPRDKESGLDYFGPRFKDDFRFASPDQPFAANAAENPQSWNLYSYVLNNPTKLVDPNGRAPHWPAGVGMDCKPLPQSSPDVDLFKAAVKAASKAPKHFDLTLGHGYTFGFKGFVGNFKRSESSVKTDEIKFSRGFQIFGLGTRYLVPSKKVKEYINKVVYVKGEGRKNIRTQKDDFDPDWESEKEETITTTGFLD